MEDRLQPVLALVPERHPDHAGPARNVVERCFNRFKQYRAIATRYDKTALSYQGWLDLVATLMWL